MMHEKKIAQMEKDIKAIKRGIIEKKKENEKLSHQLEELLENVNVQEEIYANNIEVSEYQI